MGWRSCIGWKLPVAGSCGSRKARCIRPSTAWKRPRRSRRPAKPHLSAHHEGTAQARRESSRVAAIRPRPRRHPGSTRMNDTTLTQLKIIVERAVRPVRASTFRKRKMREELLAHVSDVFEEESKLGDGRAALARTQERFGQPAELTGQLQASVPRSDWFGQFVEYFEDFRAGESPLRRATRHALMMFLIFGTLVLPIFLVQHRFSELSIIPAAAILVFGFTLMTNWMRDALYGPAGRSWLRVVLVS